MTQYLNTLFGKNKAIQQGDVEFWHGAERSGWLEKQGEGETFVMCCERARDERSLSEHIEDVITCDLSEAFQP